MKKILILSIISLLTCVIASAQSRDCVYLKNGSIIKGNVVEYVQGGSIKIESSDGSLFVYNTDQVEKITKEETNNKVLAVDDFRSFDFYHHKMTVSENGKIIATYTYNKDKKIMEDIIGEQQFKHFRTGRNMEIAGISLVAFSCASILAGLITELSYHSAENRSTATILYSVGTGIAAIGVPLWVVGHSKQEKAVLSCNGRERINLSLYPSIQPTNPITGNNLSYGATLAFRF